MVLKNIFRKLLLCTLSFTNVVFCFDIAYFGKICAAAGGALLAAGAAASWPSTSNNVELIEDAKKDYNNIIAKNREYISIFKRIFNWNTYSGSVRNNIMSNLSEPFLYEIANLNYNKHYQAFPTTILQDCETLEYHVKLLTKRANEMDRQYFLEDQEKYSFGVMHEWIEQIRGLQKELDLLKDYVLKHTSYFSLAECGWSVNKKYSEEFDLYNAYKYDKHELLRKLDKVIYSKYRHSSFAYIAYVEDIDDALEKLKYVRKKAVFGYTGMINWVNQCVDQLQFLKSLVKDRYNV